MNTIDKTDPPGVYVLAPYSALQSYRAFCVFGEVL